MLHRAGRSAAQQRISTMQMNSQMQVTIPAGVGEGQNFLVQTPAGGQMQVTVPPGSAAGQTIMISVPETSAVPVAFGQAAGTPGNDWLLQHKGLYVRQHLEVIEIMTDCETKNRYSFTPIPAGTAIPDAPDSGWSTQYRNQAGFNPLLKGKEVSQHRRAYCPPTVPGDSDRECLPVRRACLLRSLSALSASAALSSEGSTWH